MSGHLIVPDICKMKILILSIAAVFFALNGFAQASLYQDSMRQYQQHYVQQHEVVSGSDKLLMHFFDVSPEYRVLGKVTFPKKSDWFKMESTGSVAKMYRVYATVSFSIRDTVVKLNIYQSQSLMLTDQYKDHLFVPFTDATSGAESYTGGRYMDLQVQDIRDGLLWLDFNKAYNP